MIEKNEVIYFEKVVEDQVFYSCMTIQQEPKSTWYLDSGCNSHMTGNQQFFVKMDKNVSSEVKLELENFMKSKEKE